MRFVEFLTEENDMNSPVSDNPAAQAAKIWSQVNDLFVDLEDELLDMPNNPVARRAVKQLRKNDLKGLHQSIRRLAIG